MSRVLFVVAVLCAVAGGGCAAALNVSAHQAPAQDWSHYRTFEWVAPDALPTVDPRLDGNPVFSDRMHGAVASGLIERGWTQAAPATADVQIHYHANVTTRLDVARIDQAFGSCPGGACSPQTADYEAGTLILDFVDARTQRLIWRGWAQTRLQDLLQDQDRMAKTVTQAVTRMLQQVPSTASVRSSR